VIITSLYNTLCGTTIAYNFEMLLPIHEEMTKEAIGSHFSPRAMEIIIAANLKQDALRNLIGHDELHYDRDISKGDRYITEQRGLVIATMLTSGVLGAWIAFGRMLHTVQDFYSHTNYVSLWLDEHNGSVPPPPEIDPVRKDLLQSPSLHSGKVYFPLDYLYFVPGMRDLSLKLLPQNSHGRMNLDSPAQGEKFPYARAAAIKRSLHEFELLKKLLTPEMFARFVDK